MVHLNCKNAFHHLVIFSYTDLILIAQVSDINLLICCIRSNKTEELSGVGLRRFSSLPINLKQLFAISCTHHNSPEGSIHPHNRVRDIAWGRFPVSGFLIFHTQCFCVSEGEFTAELIFWCLHFIGDWQILFFLLQKVCIPTAAVDGQSSRWDIVGSRDFNWHFHLTLSEINTF